MPKTFDQPIAEEALKLVQAVPAKERAEYKAACESLAALLRRAGLARTLAFLLSKPGAQNRLAQHLERQFRAVVILPQQSLLASHLHANLDTHRAHVEIAQCIALWHKRMAQSLFHLEQPSPNPPGETI